MCFEGLRVHMFKPHKSLFRLEKGSEEDPEERSVNVLLCKVVLHVVQHPEESVIQSRRGFKLGNLSSSPLAEPYRAIPANISPMGVAKFPKGARKILAQLVSHPDCMWGMGKIIEHGTGRLLVDTASGGSPWHCSVCAHAGQSRPGAWQMRAFASRRSCPVLACLYGPSLTLGAVASQGLRPSPNHNVSW